MIKLLPEHVALVESLVGRTITAAVWYDAHPEEDEYWEHGNEMARLTLDDGRVIEFGAWGYDAWGATVSLRVGA